jgi:hypothetical protein
VLREAGTRPAFVAVMTNRLTHLFLLLTVIGLPHMGEQLMTREGGLAQGDVVVAVNRTRIGGLAELRAALDVLKPGDPVVLQLERDGGLMYLAFLVE